MLTPYPYSYVDLDADKTSQELLDRFDVKLDQIPVVICNTRAVLRNPSMQELAECLGLNSAIDESQIRVRERARRAGVDREGTEHCVVLRHDRLGPAGADSLGQCDVT